MGIHTDTEIWKTVWARRRDWTTSPLRCSWSNRCKSRITSWIFRWQTAKNRRFLEIEETENLNFQQPSSVEKSGENSSCHSRSSRRRRICRDPDLDRAFKEAEAWECERTAGFCKSAEQGRFCEKRCRRHQLGGWKETWTVFSPGKKERHTYGTSWQLLSQNHWFKIRLLHWPSRRWWLRGTDALCIFCRRGKAGGWQKLPGKWQNRLMSHIWVQSNVSTGGAYNYAASTLDIPAVLLERGCMWNLAEGGSRFHAQGCTEHSLQHRSI